MRLLAIDPGVHGFGWSYFLTWPSEPATLAAAGYAAERIADVRVPDFLRFDTVICEVPQSYRIGLQKGDQNDLIDLAFAAGRIVGRHLAPGGRVVAVRPREHKGQVGKPKRPASEPYAVELRVRRALSADELGRINWPGNAKLRMDVTDALSVGLYWLRKEGLR